MKIHNLSGKKKEVVGIFPGLGSEYHGMFNHIMNNGHTIRVIKIIDEVLKRRFVPFNGDNRAGNDLDVQLSVFAVSACYWAILSEGYKFIAFSGHSLGMYGALYAAGSFGLREAVKIIVEAHRVVNELSQHDKWAMVAISGLDSEECRKLCFRIGDVFVSNVNTATKVVVSGKVDAIEKVKGEAKAMGAPNIRDMGIPYPLHSPFLDGIRKRLEPLVDSFDIRKPEVPVYDHSGAVLFARDDVRNILAGQLERPVLWRDTVLSIAKAFPKTFLEIGPANMLSRLVKWILRDAEILTAEELINCKRVDLD